MFGNLIKESGVVERLAKTIQHELLNITTIFLGLGVGSKLSAEKFLSLETIGILLVWSANGIQFHRESDARYDLRGPETHIHGPQDEFLKPNCLRQGEIHPV